MWFTKHLVGNMSQKCNTLKSHSSERARAEIFLKRCGRLGGISYTGSLGKIQDVSLLLNPVVVRRFPLIPLHLGKWFSF